MTINPAREPSTEEWKEYVLSNFPEEIRERSIAYIYRLAKDGSRVIFDLNHVALITGYEIGVLNSMINVTERFYRPFSIPKRNGGLRTIHAPFPSLLEIQRWISKECFPRLNGVQNSVHGFLVGRSIVTNARSHLGAECVLRMDIKDFFPSINLARVIGVFGDLGYAPDVAYSLGRLCTLKGQLPQGAATSPTISNLVCRHLDSRLSGLAGKCGLVYTRYADDLTFSGSRIPVRFLSTVKSVLNEEGFLINEDKSRLVRGRKKKIITGISVGSGQLKLPRRYRRKLRAEAYQVSRYGIVSFVRQHGITDPQYLQRLVGRVAFWKSVEVDCKDAHIMFANLTRMLKEVGE